MHTTTRSPEIVAEHAVLPDTVGADVVTLAVAIAEAVTVVPVAVEIAEDSVSVAQVPEQPLV